MAAGGDSTRVVVIALVANFGIAVAKGVAGVLTRSGAMIAEAVHSLADAGNQALLLVGARRARRAPDRDHPLGYGREAYFWALLVAVLLFFLGGVFSLYEGIAKVRHPHAVETPGIAIGVLGVCLAIEAASLVAAWKAAQRSRAGVPWRTWMRESGDVNLVVVLVEDVAALVGLLLAMLALVATAVTGEAAFDAAGTLAIGVLLLVVAVFLANQIRRLVAGFRAPDAIDEDARALAPRHGLVVVRTLATWCGPNQALALLEVRPVDPRRPSAEVVGRMQAFQAALVARHPHLLHLYVEPLGTAVAGPPDEGDAPRPGGGGARRAEGGGGEARA